MFHPVTAPGKTAADSKKHLYYLQKPPNLLQTQDFVPSTTALTIFSGTLP